MQHWHLGRFEAIDNWLGKIFMVDMSFKYIGVKLVARSLVSIDLRKGLREDLKIEAPNYAYNLCTVRESLCGATNSMAMGTWWQSSLYRSKEGRMVRR